KKNKDPVGLDARAAEEQGAMDEMFGKAALNAEVADIEPIKDAKKEKVKDFAKENPEIAALLFKSWLKNENEF
ncbi:MAG: hypothetical protein ACOH15_08865, partial [Acetobacterium sp.]